jgi:hypothetical protein
LRALPSGRYGRSQLSVPRSPCLRARG